MMAVRHLNVKKYIRKKNIVKKNRVKFSVNFPAQFVSVAFVYLEKRGGKAFGIFLTPMNALKRRNGRDRTQRSEGFLDSFSGVHVFWSNFFMHFCTNC